jgi:hypothetical protein
MIYNSYLEHVVFEKPDYPIIRGMLSSQNCSNNPRKWPLVAAILVLFPEYPAFIGLPVSVATYWDRQARYHA